MPHSWVLQSKIFSKPECLGKDSENCLSQTIKTSQHAVIGVAKGSLEVDGLPKFLKHPVILCFERWFSKQNSVLPKIKHFDPPKFCESLPKFLGWLRYWTRKRGPKIFGLATLLKAVSSRWIPDPGGLQHDFWGPKCDFEGDILYMFLDAHFSKEPRFMKACMCYCSKSIIQSNYTN